MFSRKINFIKLNVTKKTIMLILVVVCIISLCACNGVASSDIFDKYNSKTTSVEIENDLKPYNVQSTAYSKDELHFEVKDYKYQGFSGKLNITAKRYPKGSDFYISSLVFNRDDGLTKDDLEKLDKYVMDKYGTPNDTDDRGEKCWNISDKEKIRYRSSIKGPIYLIKQFTQQ